MKYIVTGGAGFIGTYLVDELLGKGHQVVVVDDLSNSKAPLEAEDLTFIERDVRQLFLSTSSDDIDGIFHLATHPRYASIDDPHKNIDVNAHGMATVLEFAKKVNCKVVYASNSGIADTIDIPITLVNKDDPTTPYDATKLFGEHLCKIYYKLHGVESVILRFATVYGKNQKVSEELKWFPVIATMLECAKEGYVWITGDGKQTRDFIYVTDVVDALIRAMEYPIGAAEKFLIGTNVETSMNQIHHLIQDILDKHLNIEWRDSIKGNMQRNCLDIDKANNLLDWKPKVDVKFGIERMLS